MPDKKPSLGRRVINAITRRSNKPIQPTQQDGLPVTSPARGSVSSVSSIESGGGFTSIPRASLRDRSGSTSSVVSTDSASGSLIERRGSSASLASSVGSSVSERGRSSVSDSGVSSVSSGSYSSSSRQSDVFAKVGLTQKQRLDGLRRLKEQKLAEIEVLESELKDAKRNRVPTDDIKSQIQGLRQEISAIGIEKKGAKAQVSSARRQMQYANLEEGFRSSKENISQKVDSAKEKTKDSLRKTKEKVQEFKSEFGKKASDAKSSVSAKIEKVGTGIKNKANTVKEGFQSAGSSISQGAKEAGDKIKSGAKTTGYIGLGLGATAVGAVAKGAKKAGKAASEGASFLRQQGKNTANSVKSDVSFVERIKNKGKAPEGPAK